MIVSPLTGRHVLIMMIAFFSVIIAVNGVFLTFALSSFPGESEKKSYMQGLRYNDVLRERAEQAELGWRAEIIGAERQSMRSIVDLRLTDRGGKPLVALTVRGRIGRPTQNKDDRELSFVHLDDGVYRASVDTLDPGVWNCSIRASNAKNDHFDIAQRVIVK